MASRLRARTGHRFELITDPMDLSFEHLAEINPDYIFFPHWSHRIEKQILNRFDCVIFHMTDLPFGRGGSPLQNLIAQGINETQITALKCVAEMDAGPVYLKRPLSLYGAAQEIYLRASTVIEDMIVDILNNRPASVPQQGEPTIFKRRTPEQSNLAKATSLEEAFDLIRMQDADGYPHAFLEVGPFRFEFTRAARKTDFLLADVRIALLPDKSD
ncbi:MAG: methionyl-tRNA formyltransferase [Deltaproteobacteria bacterium]|nr:MAG: methionyl-tRNA formyltransferase [Deltaproteobacteria bacterium]